MSERSLTGGPNVNAVSVESAMSSLDDTNIYDTSADKGSSQIQDTNDTLYFEPKRVYRVAPDSSSRSSLVRVYSENESANFNQVTGSRMFDDLKHRPIPSTCKVAAITDDSLQTLQMEPPRQLKRSRGYSLSSNREQDNDDMQDEYIPEFDFAEAVLKWQSEDGESTRSNDLPDHTTSNSLNPTPPKYIENISRFNTWNTDHEVTSNSVSPNSSFVFDSSHAQVEPIPLPNATNTVSMMTPLSPSDVEKNIQASTAHSTDGDKFKNMGLNGSFQARKFSRRKTSMGDSFNSASSSLTYLPDNTISTIAELKMTPEEVLELIGKLPQDFLFMPYSQRKTVVLNIMPNKDYKLIMSLIKKFMLKTSKSSSSLNKNSLPAAAAAAARSRHGSVASQFLSSFSPAGASSVVSISSVRPDDKGMEIMGYRLGKVIGFGAWGMIRECQDVETGVLRAMKIVRFRNNLKVKKQVLKEVSIWHELKHGNILPLLNWKLDEDYAIYCLTEKVHDGTLYDLVISWGEFDTSKIDLVSRCRLSIMLCLQVISALKYMHRISIAHGDVKLENCLLEKNSKERDWKVLLCDFGMSCYFKHCAKLNTENSSVSSSGKNDIFKSPTDHDYLEFLAPFDGKVPASHNHPSTIQRSRSSTNVRYGNRLTKLQKIVKNRKLTHDDTPLGISSLPRTYGPSLTSARMANASTPSLRQFASQTTRLTPTMDMTSAHKVADDSSANVGPDPHSHIGSLPYAAPELLEPAPPPLGPSADVWALGVMLYTMLTGKLPFKHDYEPRLRAMITSGKYDRRSLCVVCEVREEKGSGQESFDSRSFRGLYDAIGGCLITDKSKRWGLDQIEMSLRGDLQRLSPL